MKVLSVSNSRSTTFKALKIKPALEEWPIRVFDAVAQSKTIQGIIKKDAEKGQDTIMRYHYNNWHYSGDKKTDFSSYLTLESPQKSIRLLGSSKKNFETSDKELVNEIRHLDRRPREEAIEDIRKNAGSIEVIA